MSLRFGSRFGSSNTGGGGSTFGNQQQQQQQPSSMGGNNQQGGMTNDGEVICPIPPNTDSISTINWSPDGRYLSAGTWDSKVHIYDVQRNGPVTGASLFASSIDMTAPVLDHAWSNDGSAVFIAGCSNKVVMWDLNKGTNNDAFVEIGAHNAPIKCVFAIPGHDIIATGGWDSMLRYWDLRQGNGKAAIEVNLPERVYAMDVRNQTLVAGCGGPARQLVIIDLSNPGYIVRTQDSPLKFQTRNVRIFHDEKFFSVSSIEGRCGIRCVNEADDKAVDPTGKSKFSFAFKCHRDEKYIYSVNSVDCSPVNKYYSVFATSGSDGTFTFWDKDKRQRIKEYNRNVKVPIVDCKYNGAGDLFAYAHSYDWSRGAENYDQKNMAPQLYVHQIKEAGDYYRQ